MKISFFIEDAKYVEAERHAAVALLQDEMIRESPPLPDRDDSPPPIYRQLNGNCKFNCLFFKVNFLFNLVQWRDPTLKEVIDYLKNSNQVTFYLLFKNIIKFFVLYL